MGLDLRLKVMISQSKTKKCLPSTRGKFKMKLQTKLTMPMTKILNTDMFMIQDGGPLEILLILKTMRIKKKQIRAKRKVDSIFSIITYDKV